MVIIVAALHAYFLVLEMLLWRTPLGLRTFRMTKEAAESSAVLAANQGLYNGFLAAGLIWGLVAYGVAAGGPFWTFFLFSVFFGGIFGVATGAGGSFLFRAFPGLVALAVVWFVGKA